MHLVDNSAGQARFVLYVRKSGPGDKSVADQEKVGRRDIAAIGGTVVAVFKDNLSASRYRRVQERPGFADTQNLIRSGEVDGLWTFANNRAHRDLDDYVPLRRLCIDTGTHWRYGGRTYDLSKAADRRAANADATRAEEQSDDISEAVSRGIQSALEDGKAHGKLAHGYTIIRDPRTGKAVRREPIEEQAKVIQWAAGEIVAGITMHAVWQGFAVRWPAAGGEGIKDYTALRQLLLNPTYAGIRTYYGKVYGPGTWEPILDMETHERVREILTDPKRKTHRGTETRYLLSYNAECGVCWSKRVAVRLPSGRVKFPKYRCSLGHVSRTVQDVDDHVEELLFQLLERPETAAALAARDDDDEVTIDADLAQIAELRAGLAEFCKDAGRRRLSAESVGAYTVGVEEEIRKVQERIDKVTSSVPSEIWRLIADGPRATWPRLTIDEKRNVIRHTMRVIIKPVPRAERNCLTALYVDARPVGVLSEIR
ncbi:recombinase family protein [Nocardia sp. NPDC058480]|uniref:recombinase family protein n=1 Tax=Nocardia sp. NPDC058480 TaxID=3346522 RepID=UPI003664D172